MTRAESQMNPSKPGSKRSALARLVAAAGIGLIGGVTLAGCATGPRYERPAVTVSDSWDEGLTHGLTNAEGDYRSWWDVFNDPTLNRLIALSVEGNLDAKIAAVRIREARLQTAVVAGQYLPTAGGSASAQTARGSENGPGVPAKGSPKPGVQVATGVARSLAGQEVAAGIAALPPAALTTPLSQPLASNLLAFLPTPAPDYKAKGTELYNAGFDASWELDVFGRIRHGVEAARATEEATLEDYRDTLVSLFGDVALAYVNYRTLEVQLKVTKDNYALQEKTLGLARARFKSGLAPQLDVTQAETNLLATQSTIPTLETQLRQMQHQIELLTGLAPGALSEVLAGGKEVPSPPSAVEVGVPADLLRQRPDIRAAERRLAAQVARVGVATADLYPTFSLAGTLGLESTKAGRLFEMSSGTYGFGPSVQWNIFNGFSNINTLLAQKAVAQEYALDYQRTVLQALHETENAMVAFKYEQDRAVTLGKAVAQARDSVKLVESLYRNGLTDFQNVLDTQRSLNGLENQLAQSRGLLAAELVRLYKALGGGWDPATLPHADLAEPGILRGLDAWKYYFQPNKGEDLTPAIDFSGPFATQ